MSRKTDKYRLVAPCGVIYELNSSTVKSAQQRGGYEITLSKEEGAVKDGDVVELQVFHEGRQCWVTVSWRLAESFQKWQEEEE